MISALPQQYKGPIKSHQNWLSSISVTKIDEPAMTWFFIGKKAYFHLAKISNFSTAQNLPKFSTDPQNGRQFFHWTKLTLIKLKSRSRDNIWSSAVRKNQISRTWRKSWTSFFTQWPICLLLHGQRKFLFQLQ